MRRVRRGRTRGRESGFIVTWDVDTREQAVANRVRYFMFGATRYARGRVYRYPGFLEQEGARYLGQSVVFVQASLLREIDAFLSLNRIDHEVTPAVLGYPVFSLFGERTLRRVASRVFTF